eukprot:TRINITY_DN8358_c0_g1_i2.p1 TRINITY_DN8358_c0_g1~~TRINITY_DN8358_c0_g1_i2.p1  ORF type:complete len:1084 (-),score=366.25 TRINITY_DN8358_c0_g1_i2:41-3124(-)
MDDEEYGRLVEKEKKRKFVENDDDEDENEYNDYGDLEHDADDYRYSDDENEETSSKPKPTPKRKGVFNQVPKEKKPAEPEDRSRTITNLLLGNNSRTPKKEAKGLSEQRSEAPSSFTVASQTPTLAFDDLLSDPGAMASVGKKKVKRTSTTKKEPIRSASTPKPTPAVSTILPKKKEEDDALPPAPVSLKDIMGDDDLMEESEAPKEAPVRTVQQATLQNAFAKAPVKAPTINQPADASFSDVLSDSQLLAAMDEPFNFTPDKKDVPAPLEEIGNSIEEWRNTQDFADIKTSSSTSTTDFTDEDLTLYWIDASEERHACPGTIFVFGKALHPKTKAMVNCCVAINNIQRVLYVAPKPGAKIDDVGMEMQQKRKEYNIKSLMSKPVDRTYIFDHPDVNRDPKSPFLKIKYSYKEPAFPEDLTGDSFCRVFGTQTSAIENFLIGNKLMGPCWLNIKGARRCEAPRSHCPLEYVVEDPKNVVKMDNTIEPPHLTALSLSMKVVQSPKDKSNEIVALSFIVHHQVSTEGPTDMKKGQFEHFSFVRKLDGISLPMDLEKTLKNQKFSGQVFQSERALLQEFVKRVTDVDPDIFVGHSFIGFDLDVLLHRMEKCKVFGWSVLGRLKRTRFPKLQHGPGGSSDSTWAEKAITAGRLICDTYLSSKDLLFRQKNYKLSELAQTQLGIKREEIDMDDIPRYFGASMTLTQLIRHTENDAFLALQLMFKLMVIPLTNQLTCLAGNLWSRSLVGGRAERNEYLLHHELHNKKYIVIDKQKIEKTSKKKKADYAGGLVLAPKKGFYDKIILLLDFNSLYPSIIQEFNICFTTIDRRRGADGEWELSEPPSSDAPTGILPRVIRQFVDKRRQVKNQIKKESDPIKLQQLDIKQRALKLTANSMYGCLGFSNARFYAKPLAELITRKGRDTLQKTVETASTTLGLEVIYGDTDSIMINSNMDDIHKAKEVGNRVKAEVNKSSQHLEIEIDGIFKSMLLLTKKKYAALKMEERGSEVVISKEVKGLDLVRRDWCDLSKDMGK